MILKARKNRKGSLAAGRLFKPDVASHGHSGGVKPSIMTAILSDVSGSRNS